MKLGMNIMPLEATPHLHASLFQTISNTSMAVLNFKGRVISAFLNIRSWNFVWIISYIWYAKKGCRD